MSLQAKIKPKSSDLSVKSIKTSLREEAEKIYCQQNLLYFLDKYAYIQDKNTGKVIKWQPWDYLIDVLNILLECPDVIIVKARQLGLSWLISGLSLWDTIFRDCAKTLFLSQGEKEAWDLLAKSKFINRKLPPFLKVNEKHPDSRELMDFTPIDGMLQALPSTEKAGHGTDARRVVRDETSRHPYAKQNFLAIGPTVDAGGQGVDVSTMEKSDLNNHFTERVMKIYNNSTREDLPSGVVVFTSNDSAAKLIFLGWKLRPVRKEGMTLDDWWQKVIVPKYDEYGREEQYPTTIEEAVSVPKARCRFDKDALKDLETRCDSPLREEYNGLVKIYQEPIASNQYCMVFDPSEGDKTSDPCAGGIVDKWLHRVVSVHGRIPLDEQARIALDLSERYFNPYTAVERNACGLTLIEKMKDLGIDNWHYHDKNKKKEGWWTGNNRPAMIMDLADVIYHRELYEPELEAIREFHSFIRTDKYPEGEARGGCHDDFVMMWAIAIQIRKSMPSGEMTMTSVPMRESML